jgi:hypothetical protein
MPRIPDVFLKSIVFLYPSVEDARAGTSAGGSGFMVDVAGARVLITNIHVAMGGCRIMRVPLQAGGFVTLELPEANWISHADGDDVAATAIDVSPEWDLQAFQWSPIAATRDRLIELNAGVGDEIVMFGRFVTVGGQQINAPLARFGNIAMMPGELITDNRGLRVEAFLIEMRSMSGFSGSPVFIYMGPGTYRGDERMMPFYSETIGLVGLDTGHIAISNSVISAIDKQPVDHWRVAQNSGVAIVTPVWKIVDVLEELTGQTLPR